MRHPLSALAFLLLPVGLTDVAAHDWPMWRYDAYRSACSSERLPEQLHLQWVRQLPRPRPAWPDEARPLFDLTYEPVVMGKAMFLPSMVSDRVIALDTETGNEKWRFYAGGPVRFAPVAQQGLIYFVSDDAYLYCLDAESGRLVWRFFGGTTRHKVLGNERLISMWCARGGPVIRDGIIYFAAGFWPFMGVFIHAVDARTGTALWCNDTTGYLRANTPHAGASMSGPAPQGYLVALEKTLLLPCGRTRPALLDRETGRLAHFNMGFRDWSNCHVVASESFFFSGSLFRLDSAGYEYLHRPQPATMWQPVVDRDMVFNTFYPNSSYTGDFGDYQRFYHDAGGEIQALDLERGEYRTIKQGEKEVRRFEAPVRWTYQNGKVRIKAGGRLYCTLKNSVFALAIPEDGQEPKQTWSAEVDGTPWSLLAADGKLFVVTKEGQVCCFGEGKRPVKYHREQETALLRKSDRWSEVAARILAASGESRGYCLALGIGSGRLIEELIRQSALYVIAVDKDSQRVDAWRRKLDLAGLYGRRVELHGGDPLAFPFPPYIADLIVGDDLRSAGLSHEPLPPATPLRALRPYGGVACFPASDAECALLQKWAEEAGVTKISFNSSGPLALLRRVGPLPGAGTWTHELADAGNSQMSRDTLVKAPLGLLWFGGQVRTSDVFRKSLNPPRPQVVGGRMIYQGPDRLSALSVYTGRMLWQHSFTDEKDRRNLFYGKGGNFIFWRPERSREGGRAYDKIKRVGYHVVSQPDGIYVAYGQMLQRLAPETGALVSEFEMPKDPTTGQSLYLTQMWTSRNIVVGLAIAPRVPLAEGFSFDVLGLKEQGLVIGVEALPATALLALDRHSGELLWQHRAEQGLLGSSFYYHNWGNVGHLNTPVTIGNGRVFCVDMLPDGVRKAIKRRGMAFDGTGKLRAFDIGTGRKLWEDETDDFSSLSFSENHDILVQTCASELGFGNGFTGTALTARKGSDGTVIWRRDEAIAGPGIIHESDIILQDGTARDLLSGRRITTPHLATGESVPWGYRRLYGCSRASASQRLVLFRSGVASYFDVAEASGISNFGGVRSGCNANLTIADGVLCKPEFEHGCYCNYPIQTSIALVHLPEVESWTTSALPRTSKPVKRIGINFGAPGNRIASNGTPWVCGSYPVAVRVQPADASPFCRHSSRMTGASPAWVTASGIRGVRSVAVALRPGASDFVDFRVRLYFAEPDSVKTGERVFAVSINGKRLLDDFDVMGLTGKRLHGATRSFPSIAVKQTLTVSFEPSEHARLAQPIVCGIEIVAE